MKIYGSRSGIKTVNKQPATILCKCANFSEVVLKILADIQTKAQDPEYSVNEHMNEIYMCMVAQQKYIHEDFASWW